MERETNPAWERLRKAVEASGCASVNAFARRIGLKRPELLYRVRRGENGISRSLAQRIHETFPQFGVSWLMCGAENAPDLPSFRLALLPEEPGRYVCLSEGLAPEAEWMIRSEGLPCGFAGKSSAVFLRRAEETPVEGAAYFVRAASGDAFCRATGGRLVREDGSEITDAQAVYKVCAVLLQ